jgi:crotonobetaine/carnitine-CoA ligase
VLVKTILNRVPFSDRAPTTLLRQGTPDDGLCVVDAKSGERYSRTDLLGLAWQVADRLVELAVEPGDHVCWVAPTSVESIAIWMGIGLCGAVDVCINDALKGRVFDHIIEDADPTAVLIHVDVGSGLGSMADALDGRRSVKTIGLAIDDGGGSDGQKGTRAADIELRREVGIGSVAREPAVVPRPEERSAIVYTSGTTGPSKGVMLSNHQQFFLGSTFSENFLIDADSVLYHYSPYHHITGRQLFIAALLTDATLVVRNRFSRETFWADINAYGCTHAITLGSAVPLLLDWKSEQSRNDGSLRLVWASPAMPQPYAELEKRFGVRVAVPYGSTELGIVTKPHLDGGEVPYGNSGRVGEYYEIQIVDEFDQVVAPDTIGEIVVRPRLPWTSLLGYLNRDEVTVDALRNFWYHTGDLGRLSEDGYLIFVDRKKDFIRTKGENVSSAEVENVLMGHRAVADCAVIPVPSKLGESDIVAVVMVSDGEVFEPEEFYLWCAAELPYYMVPRYVRIIDDLPRGASGKVEKYKLATDGLVPDIWDSLASGLRASRRGVVHSEPATREAE